MPVLFEWSTRIIPRVGRGREREVTTERGAKQNKKQKNETIGERDRGTSKPKITEKEREEKKKS